MRTIRTYVDANVLITAFRGDRGNASRRALEILDDPDRQLVVSDFLRLEVLPKPTFHGNAAECEFMQTVLDNAAENVPCDNTVVEKAVEFASRYDLQPMDALHVAIAFIAAVDEFVTFEKPTKPLFKVPQIKLLSLHPEP
ncbi:MAG TPA: PIN domain-containing protein [Chthonomonas sp.]|uniref:type II toxin-antitoxin system VapC family toxin n=1 Tax=Chthonomonas sp. TaxID=2282153 RepID=UPI002B4B4A7A|nr:PIN domain-containing protein [Chthonomonas sp.]HLI47527.1 PIN domain-containing protein [Chthonomonas sp.]